MKTFFKLTYISLILTLASFTTAWAVTVPVITDAYVDSSTTTANYGSAAVVKVNSTSRGLLSFQLQALPTGITSAEINKATLFFYVKAFNTSGSVDIFKVTTPWSELSVTNTSMPGSLTTKAATIPLISGAGYVGVDVTSLVQSWVATPTSNYGLMLTPTNANFTFDSKEDTLTSHHAFISIALKGATGATGPRGATGPQGPAVKTTANCASASIPYLSGQNGNCSCSIKVVSKTLTATGAYGTCTAVSETGSCTASGAGSSGITYTGSCCVCSP